MIQKKHLRQYSRSYNRSNSISILPSKPKIFHGRNSELSDILDLFCKGSPRIVILGAGGMGKISLAKALLHHPEITSTYIQSRFFVACNSATTKLELVALVGAHLGLNPARILLRQCSNISRAAHPVSWFLDELEILWEPVASCQHIEDFLALLAAVDQLALIITMRGAE
ncbi:hypothetical protein B0H14DRAFT_355719 [Mycena olivaceomarginata]|nr:hypothetical protein B0H14DRAFT_355719 [Mycena olivaceomarginata]